MGGSEQTVSTVFATVDTELLRNERRSLPLHITVLPLFMHNKAVDQKVSGLLHKVSSRHNETIVTVGDDDYFGTPEQVERREIHVRKLGGAGLHRLHNDLLEEVMYHIPPLPGLVMEATYVGPSYSPHVSDHHGKNLDATQRELLISELYLAQRPRYAAPHDWRITEVVQLGKREYDQTAS